MFTGIIQQAGRVVRIEHHDFGATLCIDPRPWAHRPEHGESIAVSGCCLTVAGVEEADGDSCVLRFDVIRQTLDVTTLGDLVEGDRVNLEHAVTPDTMLGGHIVQGHVDGVGEVAHVQRDAEEWRVRVAPPAPLAEVIIDKGSIAVDGVSLTVATLGAADGRPCFEVALIPTTLELTTLSSVRTGTRVNLEADYIAKTVVHWLRQQQLATAPRT